MIEALRIAVSGGDEELRPGSALTRELERACSFLGAQLASSAASGFDVASIFYCGESVLEPAYRGHGIGHRFFDLREAHARALGGFRSITFCAVVRPPDHPQRPAEYRPLDAFWRKRGYAPVDGLIASGQEAARLRSVLGQRPILITPGIRAEGGA